MFHKDTIRIGTRKSALALAQSKLVGDTIIDSFPHIKIEYVPMNTLGDKRLDISLQEIGGKGLFTKELEEALINGDIDLAVHSAKDLPLEFDNRLKIMPVLKRAAVNDIFVVNKDSNTDIRNLPKGFRIGTSSKRRSEQLRLLNKDIEILPVRGNVITRIGKIFSDEVDGYIYLYGNQKITYLDKEYRRKSEEMTLEEEYSDNNREKFTYQINVKAVFRISIDEIKNSSNETYVNYERVSESPWSTCSVAAA